MNRAPQIDVEITKTGPGFPRSGETTSQPVSVGQGHIWLRCGNEVCSNRDLSIDINPIIEGMLAAGETQGELREFCKGFQPSQRGLHAHTCGTTYHLKITIQP